MLLEQSEQFAVYGSPQGEPGLREEIQRYLERFRGVSGDAAQIVIGCGLHDQLAMIAKLLRKTHTTVALEEPGHWLPRTMFDNYAPSVPLLEQCVLRDFLAQGYWERHLRRLRTVYRKKHDAIIQSVIRHLAGVATIRGQGAGLHVVLELLDRSLDEQQLIDLAGKKGVAIIPIANTYGCRSAHAPQVMLGFGKLSPDAAEEAIQLLKQVWFELVAKPQQPDQHWLVNQIDGQRVAACHGKRLRPERLRLRKPR